MDIKDPQERLKEDRTKIIIPAKSKLCGTYAYWTGSQKINPNGQIEYHPYSKGVCNAGGFGQAAMSAMATCDHWELWSLMNSPQNSAPKVKDGCWKSNLTNFDEFLLGWNQIS